MTLSSQSIGNKIATARKKSTLSQAELARQISISSQAVGKWERGESLPDISTLNRLAEIFGVDLNYFSDNFTSTKTETTEISEKKSSVSNAGPSAQDRKPKTPFNMSQLNLAESDFSGLKNLQEKFSSSNVQKCLFRGSDLSGLVLNSNNIDGCNFGDSDLGKSTIENCNLGSNSFQNCSFVDTIFYKNNIESCDFSGADFTGASLRYSNFMKNKVSDAKWKNTSFLDMQLQDITFEGEFENCSFENCGFYNVCFQNVKFTQTFFKNNKKIKRAQFINCMADTISFAFLKSNQANLSGIHLLEK